MTERAIGYILIITGLVLILLSGYNVYTIFNGRGGIVKIFDLPGVSLDLSAFVGSEVPQEALDKARDQGKLKSEIIQKEVLNQPLNLMAHIFIMSFILNVGFKISTLGVQFVRPIKVALKQ